MFDQPMGWLVLGFAGQALFSARFLVQWISSERRKQSFIPVAFWYFSLAGGATLFAYALHIGDPVFILGQSLGVLIYSRNLYFIHKERRQLTAAE
ncbi:Lipid A biosynthesis-like protein [hydrothermal vent metagenome]|uniref:Lipid A biosynthesis-like protein n=1 Tax=hydrothermal vent metagenome TaxID=652676 RepID=A0A3B0ZFX8_9ZZZZ